MTTAERIALWHHQYEYMKKRLASIRAGDDIRPNSIRAHEVGVEQEAIEEINHAADKLKELKVTVQKVSP